MPRRVTSVTGLLWVSPWMVGFLGLSLWPFLATLYWSFCRYDLLSDPVWIGGDNYRRIGAEILAGTELGTALWNTFYYAALTIPLSVMLGVGLAVLLSDRTRGHAIYRAAVFLPSIVPTVAASIVWLWLLDPNSGLVNRLLGVFGLTPAWFNSSGELFGPGGIFSGELVFGSKEGLVLMSLWGVGQFVVIYLAGIGNIPASLYEAATLDGAGRWGRFWHITRPQLSPVIFFNVLMGFVAAIQYFTQAYVISGGTGGPENSTRVVSLHLFLWGFKYQEAGYASAVAWVIFLVIVSITLLLFGTSRRWVHVG